MGDVNIAAFVVVAVVLVGLGIVGLSRMRNGVRLILALLLMSQGAVLAFAALASFGYPAVRATTSLRDRIFPLTGMAVAVVITIAAALIASTCTALLLLIQRRHGNLDLDDDRGED